MTAAAVNFRRGRIARIAIHGRRRAQMDRLVFVVLRVLIVIAVVALALVGITDITALFAAAAPPAGMPTPGFGL